MASRILIVDDDQDICSLVKSYLERSEFEVEVAHDGSMAKSAVARSPFDLLLLDVMLPGQGGLELCREFRSASDVPIIMLTAMGQLADKVTGLELGADDYVVKPFEPRELVARVRSVLRRASRAAPAPVENEAFEFEGWRLDPLKRRLIDAEGAVVAISSVEYRLLMAFLEHPRQVLNRDRLLDMVQGREAHLFDRAVDNQVSRLRRKIEQDSRNAQLIQTVWGGGYMLAADVRRVPIED
jgi:two-component system OmpR family response regulator